MDLLLRRGGSDLTVERRHTPVKVTKAAFQVADEAKRIVAQQRLRRSRLYSAADRCLTSNR